MSIEQCLKNYKLLLIVGVRLGLRRHPAAATNSSLFPELYITRECYRLYLQCQYNTNSKLPVSYQLMLDLICRTKTVCGRSSVLHNSHAIKGRSEMSKERFQETSIEHLGYPLETSDFNLRRHLAAKSTPSPVYKCENKYVSGRKIADVNVKNFEV
jgi:hypothetical protein